MFLTGNAKRVLRNVLLLLVLFLLLSVNFSYTLANNDDEKRFAIIIKILIKLGATEDQIKKVVLIYRDTAKQLLPIRLDIQKMQLDFKSEYIKDEPNMQVLSDILAKIAKLELDSKVIQVKAELDIRKIIGNEMFFKLKTLLEKQTNND